MSVDTRVVYGVGCSWWGSISDVGERPPRADNPFGPPPAGHRGLPCCPRCQGMLMEVESEARWWADVDRHEANGNPGYRAFVEWLRGNCYPSATVARSAYDREQELLRLLRESDDGGAA